MENPFANSVKFLKAVNLLASAKGTTIRELMECLCISRRSVFRLLQALEELGFPIMDGQRRHKAEKTYRLEESYILKLPNIAIPDPCLTVDEIIHILAVIENCRRLNLIKKNRTLNSAKEKLLAMIPFGKEG